MSVQASAISGSGPTFASDVIASVNYPKGKLTFGADGTATDVDATHGLPVAGVGTFAVSGTFWQATQPVSAASLPLPTGASTESTLSTLNGKVTACNTGAVVVASGTVAVTQPDPAAGTGNITAVDAASSTGSGIGGQSLITGAATANSSVSATLSGHASFAIEVTGTWVATLQFERSIDGGTTWIPTSLLAYGSTTGNTFGTTTTNGVVHGNAGGVTNIRVRCTAYTSGTAVVRIQPGYGVGTVALGPLPTGANTIGNVGLALQTSGGESVSSLISAATTNATSVKASAGQVFGWALYNTSASARWVKLYDKASSPTVGSDTPKLRLLVPGNASGAGNNQERVNGVAFSSGIAFAITTNLADADTTAVGAGEVAVHVFYK